jgi:hypothetical protein
MQDDCPSSIKRLQPEPQSIGRRSMYRLVLAVTTLAASFVVAAAASAETTARYQATFVEPYGGPVHTPFSCAPGTSCGTANISGLGQATSEIVFNVCGLGCHVRTVTFDDGSTLVIREEAQGPFTSPGNSGTYGYIGFGLPGNPQFQEITQTIVGGTGAFIGATGAGTGTVKVAGGSAIIETSGTITLG